MMPDNRPQVKIYTDGACQPNPGKGGAGAVLIFGKDIKEISEPLGDSTNQRAEIEALIRALKALKKPCQVLVITDSKYVIGCAKGAWQRNSNLDLWEEYDTVAENHLVKFQWVRGHNGDEHNERADALAKMAILRNGV